MGKSLYEFKRWVFYNLIIMPTSAALYIPYNLIVIGYSQGQLVRWGLTSIFMGLSANFVIQKVATWTVHVMDRHIRDPNEVERTDIPQE